MEEMLRAYEGLIRETEARKESTLTAYKAMINQEQPLEEPRESLERLAKMEEFEGDEHDKTADELRCEEIFKKTLRRKECGHYEVSVCWREDINLPDNYSAAAQRYISDETKLIRRNAKTGEKDYLDEQMQTQIEEGFLEEIPNTHENQKGFIIP